MNHYLLKRNNRIGGQSKAERIFFVIIIALVISIASFSKYNLQKKIDACNKKIEVLNVQLEEEKARTDEIAEYGKYTKTKKFIEETAKEKLGLVNENEIVFKTEN